MTDKQQVMYNAIPYAPWVHAGVSNIENDVGREKKEKLRWK